MGAVLTRRDALGLSDAQVGASAAFYLAGAVVGALFFVAYKSKNHRRTNFTG